MENKVRRENKNNRHQTRKGYKKKGLYEGPAIRKKDYMKEGLYEGRTI
jgi:hypothetical protein